MRRPLVGLCLLFAFAACKPWHDSGVSDAPADTGETPFGGPTEPPPTGSKWQSVDVTGDCGRTYRTWVLVDEVCAGTDDPRYTDGFRAPMLRDGALVGGTLFAVDGSMLWALDAADPTKLSRRALVTGIGEPVAAAASGTDLLLAAGSEGLVIFDAAAPDALKERARVALAGPALDVVVEGERAYVAAGAAGVAVIDLAASPPALLATHPVAGFAAGVTVRAGVGYVAACGSLSTLDLATGATLGSLAIPNAMQDGILVAPSRDVALVGDVAFVAAGRFGAVAFDVTDPAAPKLLGNCNKPDAPSFYASGVRVQGDQLFVAAGEWGVLPLDVTDPAGACTEWYEPPPPESTAGADACTPAPPWAVIPWDPPPRGQDPVQVLPAGDVLFAFGDARRNGFRAVDVRSTADATLPVVGRWDEPSLASGVVAKGDRVLVLGKAGGLFQPDDQALLVKVPEGVLHVAEAVAGVLLDDGRWAITTSDQQLVIQGVTTPVDLGEPVSAHGLGSDGGTIAVSLATGALRVDAATGSATHLESNTLAALPPALVAVGGEVLVAAPEWPNAVGLSPEGALALDPHGAFDAFQILDIRRWMKGLPRRLLAASDAGVLEVASLGTEARFVVHDAQLRSLELPAASFVGLTAAGDRAYLVSSDRGRYRSQLFTISLGASLSIASVEAFTGSATGVAASGGRLYVADADRGVRVWDATGPSPVPLGVVELEVSP